jgi:hypothetical protein
MIHRIRLVSQYDQRHERGHTVAQIIAQINEQGGANSCLVGTMGSSQGILEFMCDIEPETATILAMSWPGIRVDSRYFA